MSGFASWFTWGSSSSDTELPEIFPVSISQDLFVKTDIVNIYTKILTDALERTHGLSDDLVAMLWDNCHKAESSDGLITLLAKAMAEKQDLFLVYEKPLNVVRLATNDEALKIREDYKKQAKSTIGIFVSFKNYVRSDMIKIYCALEFCTVSSLHKSMNLSKAVQIKMHELRKGVSLADSADVKNQAQVIAKALASGKGVLLDAKDVIDTSKPDLSATQESITFLNQKRAFYLGMPEAYINGIQTGGLGSTGEGDTKATERGLKAYFLSILKPTLEPLFGAKVTYKSQDFRQIESAVEVIKTFGLIDESLISLENKVKIINSMIGLPEDAKGDEPRPAPVVAVPPAAAVPPKVPAAAV